MPVECLGCCVRPHGRRISIVALSLSIAAVVFLSVSMYSCTFLKIKGYLRGESEPYYWVNQLNYAESSIGLFSYQEYSGGHGTKYVCVSYSSEQLKEFFDAPMIAARAFAVLAFIFMTAGSLALMISTCASFEPFLLKTVGGVLIVGSIWEALMFVVLAAEVTEEPHSGRMWWGGIINVFGTCFALAAGIVTCRLPKASDTVQTPTISRDPEKGVEQAQPKDKKPNKSKQMGSKPKPKQRRMPAGAETVTEEILPDGSRKIITTKWNKDGTTTVTEEIQ